MAVAATPEGDQVGRMARTGVGTFGTGFVAERPWAHRKVVESGEDWWGRT